MKYQRSQSEKHFDSLRAKIRGARSVNEMLDILGGNDHYRGYLKKQINKLFKGDLEKSRAFFIRDINKGEYDYDEEEMINHLSDTF